MNGETGDCNAPVRRSSRARKPNSRFADDELDGCFKKIVAGVGVPESSTCSSQSATLVRQKKGGKKRESECEEVDDNAPVSKEAPDIADDVSAVQPHSQTKQVDVVNGILDESETSTADNMGRAKSSPEKPQERRTRSNAKKDVAEDPPAGDKKRGGRKGSKGRSKGVEEVKATPKSESELGKVTNEDLSGEVGKITTVQETEQSNKDEEIRDSDILSSKESSPKDSKKGKAGKEKPRTPVGREEGNDDSEVGSSSHSPQRVEDESSHGSQQTHAKIKQPVAPSSSGNSSDDCSDISHQPMSVSGLLGQFEAVEDILPPKSEQVIEGDAHPGIVVTSEISECQVEIQEKSSLSCKQDNDKDSSVIVNENEGNQSLVEMVPRLEEPDFTSEEMHIAVESTTTSDKDNIISCTSTGKIEDNSNQTLSSSKGKANVDFSEAETSTPTRFKGPSDAPGAETVTPRRRGRSSSSEAEPRTPTRRRGGSNSSEAEAFTPTRRRGRSGSSEAEPFTPTRRRGHPDTTGVVALPPSQQRGRLASLEGQAGTGECELSSLAKRRLSSSKHSPKKNTIDEESTTKPLVGKEDGLSGVKELLDSTSVSPLHEIDEGSYVLEEKDHYTSQQPHIDVSIPEEDWDRKSDRMFEDVEVEDVRTMEKKIDDVDLEGKDSLISKGKRSRSERSSEDGKCEFSGTEHQGSPKLKKRKGDVMGEEVEFKQEGDQKRKRQDEPGDDVKRKKKKENDDSEMLSTSETMAEENIRTGLEDRSDPQVTIKAIASEFKGSEVDLEDCEKGISISKDDSDDNARDRDEAKHSTPIFEDMDKKKSSEDAALDTNLKIIEEDPDVQERRQSSVGNILSLLKRPDITKKIETISEKKGRVDSGSSESRSDSRKWREDRDRRSSQSTRREDRDRRSKVASDEMPEKRRSEGRRGSRERHSRDRSEVHHENRKGDTLEGETRSSNTQYASDSGNIKDVGSVSMVDSLVSSEMTWGSLKDMTPLTPCISVSKKNVPKKVVEPGSGSKSTESEAKVTEGKENPEVEDRSSSSTEYVSGSGNVKDLGSVSVVDSMSSEMTWESLKDMIPLTPCINVSKKNVPKKVIELGSGSKSTQSEAKVTKVEENPEFEEISSSSTRYISGSGNIKDVGSVGMVDSIMSSEVTWDSLKDMTPLTPCMNVSKKNVPKNVVEPDSGSKSSELQGKATDDEENPEVEERRTSSIGNILSFLKRVGQSGGQAKQDDIQLPSEGSQVKHAPTEDKIFSFVESSRKNSFPREEGFGSFASREEGDAPPPKSKSFTKTKERRVSRWSAREETSEPHSSQWEGTQIYTKSSLPTSGDDGKGKWLDTRNPGTSSFSKWGDTSSECQVPLLTSLRKETEDMPLPSKNPSVSEPYNMWNDQSSTWKNWADSQSQDSFASETKEYEREHLGKKSKDLVSDDENTDFGNREGMSEFIESYADELDQSTEDVSPNSSHPQMYPDEMRQRTTSSEMALSPNQDMYLMSREKELSSPPRERVWSPRSNEIVLSPKSRELMSSLRNMEVKLTPQMQELMSSQNKSDPSLSQEQHNYPTKHDGEDDLSSFERRKDGANNYDIVNIPLPGDADFLDTRKQTGRSISIAKLDFPQKLRDTDQDMMGVVRELGRNSSRDSSWGHQERYDRSRVSRYDDVKSEHVKDSGSVKEEDEREDSYRSRSGFGSEEIHDDKENLEPKVEDKEFLEEKLEYQQKIDRNLQAKDERNQLVVEQRMKSFVHLKENWYLGDRKKSKRSKEVRRMVCDCSLTKEEIVRGEVGCGEDCLNRLLMIECGSRCPLKDRCTNKRFQDYEYAQVEVFNAEEKGCGIRACKDIPVGTFIMEYVGEVFDAREFKRRRKEYSKNRNAHFYFMALKGDLFIDATRKGNISRFINHSCDPNAQTQKWTVNGELRVGFFAQKTIEVGEEINFDYRLERYGREAQRCYCGTAICRGWLGEPPDEKTKEEKEEERRQERDRRRREEKRSYVEDVDLEDEIEKLDAIKLRTRQDVLNLCRLMVRADNANSRVMLLRLVQSSTSACKRLFMDYHGLSLLWSWMADLGYAYEHASIKIEILKTLECLPITNKTQLTDSRVLGVVERWSTQSVEVPISGSPPPPPPPRPGHLGSGSANADSDSGKKSSDTSEDSDGEMDSKPVSAIVDSSSIDDISMDSVDVEQEALKSKPNLEGCPAEDDSSDSNLSEEKKSAVEPGEGDAAATATPEDEAASRELLILHKSMVELAIKLLEQWKDLKEYFRIPKKERIELMKEHEREVEEEIRGLDKDRKDKDKYRRDFDRRRRSPDREKDKERHLRRLRGERDSKEDKASDSPKMSKEQRRQLFEIQVQQEEEEAKQRKMQEEMWAMHVDRCRLLGQDPYLTPIFDPTCQYYWDPSTASWQPYNGTDPNLPVPAAYGYRPSDSGDGSPMVVGMPSTHVISAQPLVGHLAPDSEAATPNYDDPRIDPATIPLPGEVRQTSPTQPLPCQAVPVEGTPPQGARVRTFPAPDSGAAPLTPATTMPVNINANAVTVPFVVGEEPPPPPPGPITIQLPPRWKMARDSEGHVYFYHTKSRTSQWEPPTWEQHKQLLEAGLGSESDSDSSSSDSDSTSTTDSEDFSSDEEEEEEEVEVTTVERGELCDEKMIRRHRAKKPRSEALVQERMISPVMELDKEQARRERREAKERAQKEARQERQEDRLSDVVVHDGLELSEEMETISDKIQRMERSETQVEKEKHDHRESKSKSREKTKSKERAATAIADNSDSARKCKENFRAKMATYIVSVLNPYRRDDCRLGRITCNEDFKYLARKLTHFVMIKELKQLHSVEDLECNDSVKYKTKDFVRKYMSKYGPEFKRDPSDTKEY